MYKITLLFLLIFWTLQSTVGQNVPDKISYQGILYENAQPFTGSKKFSFTIGSWTETHDTVQITNGRYIVQLGSIMPLTVSDFEGQAVATLEIKIDDNTLSPMVDLLTVPYAFYAQKAEDANHLNGQPASFYEIPVGSIVAYGGTTIPVGWLLCDGGEVSRTDTTAALFAALGVAWGAGDFANTFHLPDLRARFIRGVDGEANRVTDDSTRVSDFIGGNIGDAVGSYQEGEIQNHTHERQLATNWPNDTGPEWRTRRITDGNIINRDPSIGYTGGAETRPINANVYFIIKY
ncbi:MAG: phage tail protein [Bacteroidota bacterium]